MIADRERHIGESTMKNQPNKPLKLKLGNKVVKNRHLDDESVNTNNLMDSAVTPDKLNAAVMLNLVLPAIHRELENINITIDTELKDSSNPVANRVIWAAIDWLKRYIDSLIVGDGDGGIAASILDTYATLVYVNGLISTVKDEVNQTIREKLVNYYLKSETYNKNEVNELISILPKFKLEVVDSLPTNNIDTQTVYIVKSQEDDIYYQQWIYKDGSWKLLGEARLNLEGYALKTEVQAITNLLITKQEVLISGRNIKTINGQSILGEGNLTISTGDTPSDKTCGCPKHVFLTQEEYDALEVKEKDTLYFIVENKGDEEWTFGDSFPIILSGDWSFGDSFPIILK